MRIGIIGIGRAGKVHLDAWQLVPGAQVAAVYDPSAAARQEAMSAGLQAYGEIEELLDEELLDAVSICAPPADHADLADECFKRGLHVLCEKPLALNTQEAMWMLRMAAAKRCHLLLATKFRHVPEVVMARDL